MIYKGVSESSFHFVIPEIKIPTEELIELYESLKEYDYPWNEYKGKYDLNKNYQPRGDGGLGAIYAPDKDGRDLIDYPLVQNIIKQFNFTYPVYKTDIAFMTYKPGFVFKKGRVGLVSKSGTLTYEAADQIVKEGFGISTAIGIGGDPIIGTTVEDAVKLFFEDDETDCVVMIGEIGGQLENNAAKWIKKSDIQKPVIGFIAGETAPKGRTMGHAGAIVGGKDDTASAKKIILRNCGVHVVDSPADIGKFVKKILN